MTWGSFQTVLQEKAPVIDGEWAQRSAGQKLRFSMNPVDVELLDQGKQIRPRAPGNQSVTN
jgi:hypothetical protein